MTATQNTQCSMTRTVAINTTGSEKTFVYPVIQHKLRDKKYLQ